MGTFGLVHLLIILAIVGIPIPPLVKILGRMGLSGWWAVLYYVPIGNWIGLWVLASAKWPKTDS